MPIDPQEFAKMLGAEIVGEVPDVGGGPFGMARLAHLMHEVLTPSRGERPGRPTNPNWVTRCKVPMSDATLQRLTELATEMSTAERKISPMQVAAQLLEEALGRVGVETEAQVDEVAENPEELPSHAGTDQKTKLREADSKAGERSLPKPSRSRPSYGDKPQQEGSKAGQRRKKA
jgi:hypothetical protein